MTFQLSRAGLNAELSTDLPFNNKMVMRIRIDSGLKEEDPAKAFIVAENTHLWLLFCAASLLENEGAAGQDIYDVVKPWDGMLNDDFHDGLCRALWDADRRAPYN